MEDLVAPVPWAVHFFKVIPDISVKNIIFFEHQGMVFFAKFHSHHVKKEKVITKSLL